MTRAAFFALSLVALPNVKHVRRLMIHHQRDTRSACDDFEFAHVQDTGATLARQAERSAAQLQQVLATFPPSPNSAEMERLQRKIDRQTQLTRHWRHAFGALYAKRDTQLSTTRLLYTMLKLDKVD